MKSDNLKFGPETTTNLDKFLSKAPKQHSIRKLRFSFDQILLNVNWSLWCAVENSKPWVMLWAQSGDWTSKIWEKLDFSTSQVILLGILCPLVMWSYSKQPAARREAHWITRSQNVEGPAAARAVQQSGCGCSAHAPKWEKICTTSQHDVKDRRVQ